MKTKFFLLLALPMLMFLAACGDGGKASETTDETNDVAEATNGAVNYSVDPAGTTIEWVGKKVTGQHNGTIAIQSGTMSAENGELTAGNFVIDMKSITNMDLTDEEMKGQLIGHLNSPDFFNTDSFPTASFEISNVAKNDMTADPNGRSHLVTGNLTIKGITKGITVYADIDVQPTMVTIKSDFDIDRTQWDIKYGSGKFFEGLGDKMINDLFTLAIKLTAKADNA